MYALIRPLLFALDPERAHRLVIAALRTAGDLLPAGQPLAATPTTVMGIEFPNRVGLAAGLDKNGDAIDGLARLGFGFLEIGTVTPRPQPGNPRPRMFRLPTAEAIINRLGFNNHGVDAGMRPQLDDLTDLLPSALHPGSQKVNQVVLARLELGEQLPRHAHLGALQQLGGIAVVAAEVHQQGLVRAPHAANGDLLDARFAA